MRRLNKLWHKILCFFGHHVWVHSSGTIVSSPLGYTLQGWSTCWYCPAKKYSISAIKFYGGYHE
jgi:hypothetical protein